MYVNSRWAGRTIARDVRHIKRWVRDMACSCGAYQGGVIPPSGSDSPETPPQSGDALFSDAETKGEGIWIAKLATNDTYTLINLTDSIREEWPDANVIEVYQSEMPRGRGYRSYKSRGKQLLTTYCIVDDRDGYTVLEMANLTPYSVGERGAIKPRAIAITRPGNKRNEDDEGTSNPSTSGGGCRGRGVVARRSIMARVSVDEEDLDELKWMGLSMGISVTVKVGGETTTQTLGEWLADTEAYIENNCKNFMDVRNLFDFYSTQPEESVETVTDTSIYKTAEPERVSMPIGDTNIMIAGAKLSTDPSKQLEAIYPTYIIREIPQFIDVSQSKTYAYTITKLPDELRENVLSRTRFGLTTYKDDIYYLQSQIANLTLGSVDGTGYTNNIETALSNTTFDLDNGKAVDKAHFYRLHSTAISVNANTLNTHGTPPLMHPCLYDIKCYDSGNDEDKDGFITIDLTRNSPFKDNEYTYDTPYTTASIIAKFTKGNSIEEATGKVLYYLRPIHISQVSDAHKEAFGDSYYPYCLTTAGPNVKIQIYQCYTPDPNSTFSLHLPARQDDEYIKEMITDMKNAVKTTMVTDYGVRILPADELVIDDNQPFIWNKGDDLPTLENWRDPDKENRDITVRIAENEFIVHYGVAFGVTGNVFGLPDPSDDISIDFLTNIDSVLKFNTVINTYGGADGNAAFFMLSMFPRIPEHGNPEVAIVLTINVPQYSDTVSADMYLCTDVLDYYNDPDLDPKDSEPILEDDYFWYPSFPVGNPFPLTARVIRDIYNGKITSKRYIQFSLHDATMSNIAFHKYLNDLILNYRQDDEDSGWDGDVTSLSYNLLNSRWYAGHYTQPRSRSMRRKRCARTSPGSLYYRR